MGNYLLSLNDSKSIQQVVELACMRVKEKKGKLTGVVFIDIEKIVNNNNKDSIIDSSFHYFKKINYLITKANKKAKRILEQFEKVCLDYNVEYEKKIINDNPKNHHFSENILSIRNIF